MSVFILKHKEFGKICEIEVYCCKCREDRDDSDWYINISTWFNIANYSRFLIGYMKNLEFEFDNEKQIENALSDVVANFSVLQHLKENYNANNGVFGVRIKHYALEDKDFSKDKGIIIQDVRTISKTLANTYGLELNED